MQLRRTIVATFTSMLGALLVLAATVVPAAAGGGPYTYPGCGATLQACIDLAASGETITIATELVDELPSISKGLNIYPAPGFTPEIRGFGINTNGLTVNVTIDDIDFTYGVFALFTSGTGHSVTVRDGRIGSASSFGSAIIFTTEVPADLILEGNAIRSIGNQDPSVQVNATAPGGVTSVSVIANRVTQHGHDNGGSGISLGLGGAGAFRADVMNNTVWDVAGCNCASSVDIQLENSVNADINIVGNTMEGSVGSGIALRNDLDAGGGVALDVFDNIISHQDFAGILLEDGGGTLTYRGGYNDFFANGFEDFDGHAPGPATLHVDPKFVNRTAGNLKLKPSSPLIDAGLVCTPGGVADPDAAGRHRLAGPTVDFGAYEFGAALPAGIVHVGDATAEAIEGTSGADILCGYGGGDFIEGKGGSDYLDGGPGGDVIFGGSGSDLLFGRGGADLLCARDGTGGNDRLDGGKGTDQYRADGGDIRISVEQTASCAHQ